MANRIKFTPQKREQFLADLAEGFSVTHACKAARITQPWAYQIRLQDPEFAAAWEDAVERGTQRLADEARRRAVDGVLKKTPILRQGHVVAYTEEIQYSDTLLMFLLKARAPTIYRENIRHEHQHSGAVNGTVTVQHEFDYHEYTHLFSEFTHPRSLELAALTGDSAGESLDSADADTPPGIFSNGAVP